MDTTIISRAPYQGIKDAAKATGISAYAIRKAAQCNRIAYVRSGNRYLINVPALLQQLSENASSVFSFDEDAIQE